MPKPAERLDDFSYRFIIRISPKLESNCIILRALRTVIKTWSVRSDLIKTLRDHG